MARKIITLPIYFQLTKKKTVLVSMNWFRNAHYHSQNKLKSEFSDLLRPQLSDVKPYKGKYAVEYLLYYKNPTCDLTNICSLMSKVFNDVLQSEGIVVNDNVNWLVKETFSVGHKDTNNPRVEIVCKKQ